MYDFMSKIKTKYQYDIIEKVTTKLKESICGHMKYIVDNNIKEKGKTNCCSN